MIRRERALKILLVAVGLFFSAAIHPAIGGIRDVAHSDTGDTMMMGIYRGLGNLSADRVPQPLGDRSLIAFAACRVLLTPAVMSVLGLEMPVESSGFLVGSGLLVVIGVVLIVLGPRQQK